MWQWDAVENLVHDFFFVFYLYKQNNLVLGSMKMAWQNPLTATLH